MRHHKLHEIAKFASGLVLADFLVWWWMAAYGILPTTLWGMTLTPAMVAPGMIFDAAVFIMLVHYGWHIGKTPALRNRTYLSIVGIVLGLVALAHLIRLFSGVDVSIAGWDAPLWISWIGTIAAAYLSYMSFRLASWE